MEPSTTQPRMAIEDQIANDHGRENYKVLLSSLEECLTEYTVYDVLPVNVQVIVLDKLVDLAEVIRLMNQNDTDTAYVWNSEMMTYDGILTYTDLVEIITFVYNTMSLQQNAPKLDIDTSESGSSNDFETKASSYNTYLTKFNMYAQGQNFLKENITVDPVTSPIKFEDKQFIKELKSITLQMWHNFISEHILWRPHELIAVTTDDRLLDACAKMKRERLHKIAVYDKESQLVIGTLSLVDVMLFFIKNFTAEKEDMFKIEVENLQSIKVLKNVLCVRDTDYIFHTLEVLLHYRVSNVPVVNEKQEYVGIIMKSDIFKIVRDDSYHYLSYKNGWLIKNLCKQPKIDSEEFSRMMFKPSDSLITIVEKLVLSPGNVLIYIEENTKKINGIITLIDLLDFFIQEDNIERN